MADRKDAKRKKFKGLPPPGVGPTVPVTTEVLIPRHHGLKGSQPKVMLALIHKAWENHSDSCEMSKAELVEKTGVGIGAVNSAVKALDDKGLIEIRWRTITGKGNLPNLYTLKVPNPYDGSLSPEEIAQLRKECSAGEVT